MLSITPGPPISSLFPYTTLFRSRSRPTASNRAIAATRGRAPLSASPPRLQSVGRDRERSEEHTSELQSRRDLVCRLLLEKKKDTQATQVSAALPRDGPVLFAPSG